MTSYPRVNIGSSINDDNGIMTPFSVNKYNDFETSITNIEMDDLSLFDMDMDIYDTIKQGSSSTKPTKYNNECSLSLGNDNIITNYNPDYTITPSYTYNYNSNEMSLSLGNNGITPKIYTPSSKNNSINIIESNKKSKNIIKDLDKFNINAILYESPIKYNNNSIDTEYNNAFDLCNKPNDDEILIDTPNIENKYRTSFKLFDTNNNSDKSSSKSKKKNSNNNSTNNINSNNNDIKKKRKSKKSVTINVIKNQKRKTRSFIKNKQITKSNSTEFLKKIKMQKNSPQIISDIDTDIDDPITFDDCTDIMLDSNPTEHITLNREDTPILPTKAKSHFNGIAFAHELNALKDAREIIKSCYI